jgi:hypothetical protein
MGLSNADLFRLASDMADRIEALTAKCEALGQEVNMAKYGQPDFAWSIHVEAMADLEAECARLRGLIDDVVCGRGMFGLSADDDLKWAMQHLGSALTGKETK